MKINMLFVQGDDVCAICDDGGFVTCCDGGCMRSFHLTEEHGEGSKCPLQVNKQSVCHGEENKDDKDMQFAVCRLCPTTYHRKCLPRKHEIIKELGIPRRKLIIFPEAKKTFAPKDPESTPKEQDILVEQELLGHPASEPSQTPPPPATTQNQCVRSNPMDSFAPSSLYTDPYPGSCGWLDD
ncbi:hypothetical protein C2845_PM05G07730 [Panicum miliaceum]|uniref:Zinc finger PHD-type domain-containing protein n=1 Tax=Panicum miliaceum TaxID=4540 RepID=A0A3L6SW63_PANMI|nr:hypothetical protein C2845_PM05G07730 [Panicum miliaceum]